MANASREALDAGILLSKHLVEPHKPRDTTRRIIELPVREAMFAKLVELARKAGRTPAQYAFELFEAAYSARCAPTGDAELDAAVAGIDVKHPGQFAENRKSDDLARQLEIVSASLRDQETENRQLRAKLAHARDERNSWRDDATANDEALQSIGEEFGIHAGEHRIDGIRRILGEMRDQIAALTAEDAERASRSMVLVDPPSTRVHINGDQERSPASNAALEALAKAARDRLLDDPTIQAKPDPATVRAVRGLRAAGNSAIEVARALKLPIETVRQILGGGK